jgi:hypothetical protein
MINMLHTQTKQRSPTAAEGKFVGLVAKIKRMVARLFPTRGETRQKELVLAERRRQDLIALRRRLRCNIRHRPDSRDY